MARKGSKDAIVAGVVAGLTRAEVARIAGVSERTLRRRLREDEGLIVEVASARAEIQEQVVGRLASLAHRALDEVEDILCDGSNGHKLAAAKLVLDQQAPQRAGHEDVLLRAEEIALARELRRVGGQDV